MQAERYQQPKEIVKMRIVVRIGDTLRLNHQQTLEGVDDLLNLLPTLAILPNTLHISLNDLIHALVLFDENQ